MASAMLGGKVDDVPEEETFEDATDAFLDTARALGKGELLVNKTFHLARAITAVELFTPKMDPGMEPKGRQPEEVRLEEVPTHDADAVVGICDRIWHFEFQMNQGATNAQSVMTCLYAHQPVMEKLAHSFNSDNDDGGEERSSTNPPSHGLTLYALLLATLHTVCVTYETGWKSQILFEEDYYFEMFDIPNYAETLLLATTASTTTSMTTEQQLPDTRPYYKYLHDTLQRAIQQESDPRLRDRLTFRAQLCLALQSLDGYDYESAERYLKTTREALRSITVNYDLQSSPAVEAAFLPRLNYWRIAPHPPRPTAAFTPHHARSLLSKWSSTLTGLDRVCAMRSVITPSLAGNLVGIFHYLSRNFAVVANVYEEEIEEERGGERRVVLVERREEFDALVRGRLAQALCDPEKRFMGIAPWGDLLEKDVAAHGLASLVALNFEESEESGGRVRSLRGIAMNLVYEVIHTMVANRARLRRRLVRRLDEWGSFALRCEVSDAATAGMLDAYLDLTLLQRQERRRMYEYPLGTWAMHWCTRLGLRYLELGFELDLYSPLDAPPAALMLSNMTRIAKVAGELAANARRVTMPNSLAVRYSLSAKDYNVSRALVHEKYLDDVRSHYSLGVFWLLVGCTRREGGLAVVNQPEAGDDLVMSPEVRFEHIFFEPFSSVWLPMNISYGDYNRIITDETKSLESWLEAAEKWLRECTALVGSFWEIEKEGKLAGVVGPETGEDLKAIQRAAMLNLVAAARLKRGDKKRPCLKFETGARLLVVSLV